MHAAGRAVRRVQGGARRARHPARSPTRCRPAGAAPASTSGATRRTASTPDMMTFAKGLGNGFAIGGVVARAELMDALPATQLLHLRRQPDLHGGRQRGPGLRARPRPAGQRRPASARSCSTACGRSPATSPIVGDVRGKGLMLGVEFVQPGTREPDPAPTAAGASRRPRPRPAGRQGRPVRQRDPDGPAADPDRGRGTRGPGDPGRRDPRRRRGWRHDRRISHWIDGKPWATARARQGEVFDPATGRRTAKVDFASAADVDAAVAAAARAARAWRDASLAKRSRCCSPSASCCTPGATSSPR